MASYRWMRAVIMMYTTSLYSASSAGIAPKALSRPQQDPLDQRCRTNSCSEGFLTVHGHHPAHTNRNLYLCLNMSDSNRSGTFYLHSKAPHAAAVARISGSTIDSPVFQLHSEEIAESSSIWYANFSCLEPSAYTANVYILIEDSGINDFLSLNSCITPDFLDHPSYFEWNVGSTSTNHDQCKIMSSTDPRWHIIGEPPSTIHQIRMNIPYSKQVTLEKHTQWIEDGIPATTPPGFGISDHVACLIGDSQTRNLVNSIVDFLGYGNCNVVEAQNTKTACVALFVRYIPMNYPSEFSPDIIDTYECTHAYFNFGQWQLGRTTSPPWSVDTYRREVRKFLLSIAPHLMDRGVEVSWMSTNAYPMSSLSISTCPPRDWRVANWISAYNREAFEVVQEVSQLLGQRNLITFLDLFKRSNALLEFSFDGSHYQGFIGVALAKTFLRHFAGLLQSSGAAAVLE
jgi:hypothetical protein